MLFLLWNVETHRPTRDVDLLGRGSPELAKLEDVLRQVCESEVEDDGIIFVAETVRAERIREDQEYEGVRVTLQARLGQARIKVQVDIGFGDAVTPGPIPMQLPCLLDLPAPQMLTYPRETVVAEKYQAMVELGMLNTRLKDFYDLNFLASEFSFEGGPLSVSIEATFTRRQTPLPMETPTALTPIFAEDRSKQNQWKAFLKRTRLGSTSTSLTDVIDGLGRFLLPLTKALVQGQPWTEMTWPPGGPWCKVEDVDHEQDDEDEETNRR